MENKIIKRHKKESNFISESIPSPEETIISLQKEISRLTEDNDKLKAKIKKQDTTILTVRDRAAQAVHRFVVLQAKHDALQAQSKAKEITPPTPEELKVLGDFLAYRREIHNEPPEE